ncbi:hypothetical protein ABH922_002993 [Rhodococcus sp. 27YEA15]|uniref:hypothetical protein n=1 Tax=Rhodococcus sp. 27YEA15 TaxID=3156259 RepID=UPI003C7A4ACE
MARLITFVHVADESGVGHAFGPDDAVPEWAAKKITNPDVWDSVPAVPDVAPEPKRRGRPPKPAADSE